MNGVMRQASACAAMLLAMGGCDQASRVREPTVVMASTGTTVSLSAAANKCPRRGTEVITTADRRIVYFGALPTDPEVCLIQMPGTAEPTPYLFPIIPLAADYAAAHREALRKFFPFQPGKTVSFDALSVSSNSQWRLTLTAEGYGTVTVPAGTFNVMIIRLREEGFGGNYAKASTRWFIDRDTMVPVQAVTETEQGQGGFRQGFQARSIGQARI